jgi:hypothetical protein
MPIKTIPLSRLETDLKKTLGECAESGETVVVEMPDQRLLAIQSLDPNENDSLTDLITERPDATPNAAVEVRESLPDGTEFKAV